MNQTRRGYIATVAIGGLGTVLLCVAWSYGISEPARPLIRAAPMPSSVPQFDFVVPGVQRPATDPVCAAEVPDDETVFGVSVKGRYRAYRAAAMNPMGAPVVNDVIEKVPVTVTYWNVRNCVRAFTRAGEPDEPLDVSVRGMAGTSMLLTMNGEVLLQEAEVVPLERLEVEVTSWKEWKTAHPDTDVFVGTDLDCDFHPSGEEMASLVLAAPGIRMPPVVPARFAGVIDAAEVIGVRVRGHFRAYRVSAMCEPQAAVVNDVIAGVPVTVTHSYCGHCVRAFTNANESDKPLDIGLEGWKNGKMLLAIDGTVLPQDSNDIQQARLETQVTTWKDWRTAHPDTDIYTGLQACASGAAD